MSFTLATETYPGFPAGMNQALPAQDLQDTEARYLQDALLDFPALTRRRGPITPVSGIAQPAVKGSGIFTVLDPQGNVRYGFLGDDGATAAFYGWSANLASLTALMNLPNRLLMAPPSNPYRVVSSSAGLKGGLLIGTRSDYGTAGEAMFLYWMGGISQNYGTGTVSVARGSTAVSGSGTSWTANVTPGTWLFSNTDEPYTNALVGCVKSVNSNTSITLMDPSPYVITAKNYTAQALRSLYPRVMTGRVTCATTATDLNGGDTAFLTQAINSGSWQVYRYRDWAYIGKVSTVESEIHATLAGNAAINMANEQYIAIRADAAQSTLDVHNLASFPGFLTAQYAGRQFYFNTDDKLEDTYRLVYTEVDDPEAYNLGYAGTWTPVQNTSDVQESGRAIAPAYNALIILKDTEAFALTGTDPSVFSLQKIGDDGTLSTGSVQTYNGGVIWAGRQGVHMYDGVQVQNLTLLKLGQVWKNTIATLDPTKYRMWSFIHRDHYHLFVESVAPTVAPQKGSLTLQPTRWNVKINLVTNAVTLDTNTPIRGALSQPSIAGGDTWFLVNGQKNGDTTDKAYVCDANALFDSEGTDIVYGDYTVLKGGSVGTNIGGPDFYLESKKFDAGDGMRLKKWKILAANYLAQGGSLKIDTVLGLNDFGSTLTTSFPASVFTWDTLQATFRTWDALKAKFSNWNGVINGVFIPKRVKFQKQSQYLSFRIYQSTNTMQRVKLGPFMLAYKVMRAGRV